MVGQKPSRALQIVPLLFTLVVTVLPSSPPQHDSPSPTSTSPISSPPIDPRGYLLFCLCMGRLGNQMEHFLGALEFAHRLNRTLVLPPFVYSDSYRKVTWNEWFQVKPLRQYHRVVLADPFMKRVAPKVWPVGRRVGFCWRHPRERERAQAEKAGDFQCDLSGGNAASFWQMLNIEFDSFEGDFITYRDPDAWQERYPAEAYPVIALMAAPAPFPMRVRNWGLQKYVRFSEDIEKQTDKFMKGFIGEKTFVGIHLRNGLDWKRACQDFADPTGEMATGMVGEDSSRKSDKGIFGLVSFR